MTLFSSKSDGLSKMSVQLSKTLRVIALKHQERLADRLRASVTNALPNSNVHIADGTLLISGEGLLDREFGGPQDTGDAPIAQAIQHIQAGE